MGSSSRSDRTLGRGIVQNSGDSYRFLDSHSWVIRVCPPSPPILARSNEILEELESAFAKEATGDRLAKNKTREPDGDALFVQKHKSVLDKLASTDVNHLTPLEAINLLSQIKAEIGEG